MAAGQRHHPRDVAAVRRVDPQPDLHLHRTRQWSAAELEATSLPRTTPERTLLDLVGASTKDKLAGLVTDAIRSRVTTPERVLAAAIIRPKQRHRRLLVEMLAEAAGGVESALELAFAKVLRRHKVLEPRRQVRELLPRAGAIRIDALFDPYDVIAELDGRLGHFTAADVARDQTRDNAHALSGRVPLRFGWVRVISDGCEVAAEVVEALSSRGWTGQPRACGPSCALGRRGSSTDERYRREA